MDWPRGFGPRHPRGIFTTLYHPLLQKYAEAGGQGDEKRGLQSSGTNRHRNLAAP